MLRDHTVVAEEQHFILSTLSPTSAQKRLALAVVLGMFTVFMLITLGVLSGYRTSRIDSFMPAYLTAMFVCESITAILLFARFSIFRLRSTLVLANGYLFAAVLVILYALAFPGVLGPSPAIGNFQTAGCFFILWHCGFPLFVIAYALLKSAPPGQGSLKSPAGAAIAKSVALTLTLIALGAIPAILGGSSLPRIVSEDGRFTVVFVYIVAVPVALLSACAIVVLWVRQRSMLDLWLMVVMFIYVIEMPTTYYPDPSRFSAPWYAARLFGFLGSSLVLIVLLYEIQKLYESLLDAVLAQRREREARLMTGDAVAASIAHEVRQPLTAMVTTADAGLRFLDRAPPNLDKIKQALTNIVADGHRAGAVVANIRANFKTDAGGRTPFDLNKFIQEALAVTRGDLLKHGIVVRTEANTADPQVRGNRVQLQQVLLNLITNAIDAMASKDGPKLLTVNCDKRHGDRVLVSIADTGSGIRSEDVERVFNPLFTTKSHGMGMGLAICRAIVEADGGNLWHIPNRSGGAVFQFTLQSA